MPRTRYAVTGITLSIATTLMGTGLLGSLLGVRSELAGISAGFMGIALSPDRAVATTRVD